MPHVLPTHVHPHHPPTTHRPSYYRRNTTAVEQEVPSNPQRQHTSTAVRTTAVHLWYARGWVGFICTSLRCSTFRGRARAVTHQAPTTHPPTNPPPQQYNSNGAVRTDQSTTTAQYGPQRYTRNTPGAGWDLHFLTILHLPGESASRPRKRLLMPPACGVGTHRLLCCRAHRGLICGAGVARACGR